MKKKGVLIAIIILLLIVAGVVVVSTSSKNSNSSENKIQIEKSFEKIFNSNVSIRTTSHPDSEFYSETKIKNTEADVSITDSSITIVNSMYGAQINYSLKNNTCVFTCTTKTPKLPKYDENMIGVMDNAYVNLLTESFLALADAVNVDLTLACTYFNQVFAKADDDVLNNITDNVYRYNATQSADGHVSFELVVDLENLSKLTNEDIAESPCSIVTVSSSVEE